MNRLIVLLVVSMLGTGCVVHDTCDAKTVSLGWSSFRLDNNAVVSTCSQAGVSQVDVFMDDVPVVSVNCTDGGVNVTGVLNDSSHLFTIEGIDAVSGAISLRDEVSVPPSNCTNPLVDTQPSQGAFVLDFSFISGPNFCSSATNSFIWFTIKDNISGDLIAVDRNTSPTLYTCGNGSTVPVPIPFPLASGPYTLQRTEEVIIPGNTQLAGNCNATGFTMAGGTQTSLGVPLTDGIVCF
jgi:hypothetical protein